LSALRKASVNGQRDFFQVRRTPQSRPEILQKLEQALRNCTRFFAVAIHQGKGNETQDRVGAPEQNNTNNQSTPGAV
jgi:hypothetical protein